MKFISDEDPMQAMLKWLCERLMEAEVESKLCAEKSERSNERHTDQVTAFAGLTQEWERCIISSTNLLERLNREIRRRTRG